MEQINSSGPHCAMGLPYRTQISLARAPWVVLVVAGQLGTGHLSITRGLVKSACCSCTVVPAVAVRNGADLNLLLEKELHSV